MIKGSIQEEGIKIVNIYASNVTAPKNIKQIFTDIKGDMDSNTIIIGDFNTPLTSMDKSLDKSSNIKSIRKHWL